MLLRIKYYSFSPKPHPDFQNLLINEAQREMNNLTFESMSDNYEIS